MPKTKRIALLIEPTSSYGRGILRGIAAYARTRTHWRFQFEHAATVEQILDWGLPDADGLIIRELSLRAFEEIQKHGLPTVHVGSQRGEWGLPGAMADNLAVGAEAADHFLERGYTRFATCGYGGVTFSEQRMEGFVQRLAERGHEVNVNRMDVRTWSSAAPAERSALHEPWLRSLEPPVAVFCVNDEVGRHVAQACAELDIRVPEHAALLGVDNDEVLCELADPPLSSIDLASDRVGFLAGQMMSSLLTGRKLKRELEMVKPSGVVTRRSSEHVPIEDPIVSESVRFIHEHATEGLDVSDVVKHAGVSRRWFEVCFRRAMGQSPASHIRKVQLDRAKSLLATTDLMMPEVAKACGFTDAKLLIAVFRREVGKTPTAYRRQYRLR